MCENQCSDNEESELNELCEIAEEDEEKLELAGIENNLPRLSKAKMILFAFVLYLILFLIALLIRGLSTGEKFYSQDLRGFPIYWCLLATGAGLLVVLFSRIKAGFVQQLEKDLSKIIRTAFGELRLIDAFILALLSSVAEEMLFRWAVQLWLGIIPASVIFGFLHFHRNWWIFAMIMGFLLGALYEVSQSLYPPILMHFIINWINLYRLSHLKIDMDLRLEQSVIASDQRERSNH